MKPAIVIGISVTLSVTAVGVMNRIAMTRKLLGT